MSELIAFKRCLPAVMLCAVVTLADGPGAAMAEQPQWPDEQQIAWLTVHADFSVANLRPLLANAVELRNDVSDALRLQTKETPIHLYLFRRKSTFEKYVRRYYPSIPPRRALFIKERGHAMVFAYRSPELATDLRHEMTHAILNTALPFVPLWLDEGIAEYFEVTPVRRLAGHSHLRSIDRRTKLAAIEQLERVDGLAGMTKKDYRDAWAWVHWMLTGSSNAKSELQSYLAGLQAHQVQPPLSTQLRRFVPDAHALVHQHVLRTKTAASRSHVRR